MKYLKKFNESISINELEDIFEIEYEGEDFDSSITIGDEGYEVNIDIRQHYPANSKLGKLWGSGVHPGASIPAHIVKDINRKILNKISIKYGLKFNILNVHATYNSEYQFLILIDL